MRCGTRLLQSTLALAVPILLVPLQAGAGPPVVKAVFFYMPTCDHCHRVIEETLPPIAARYGDQFVIAFVDASTSGGNELFYAATERYAIPEEARGVPLMIVGSEVMNGEVEIPSRLSAVIERGLASGGVDWPDVPGLKALAEQAGLNAASTAVIVTEGAATALETPSSIGNESEYSTGKPSDAPGAVSQTADLALPSIRDSWAADPQGFGIALAAMAFMLASTIPIGWAWLRGGLSSGQTRAWHAWTVPVLCIVGVIVAAYLGYVESTSTRAVCGPVGDCNTVQDSDYALLFGALPVGVLGLAGYLVILALWAWRHLGHDRWVHRLRWLLPLVVMFGVVFGIYLTFLELFVIRAVCMWCVTSAVTMTLLLWAVHKGGAEPAAM